MTQNIYDNPDFFAAYSRLPRSVHGLEGAPEWPVLRALLPNPAGLNVLDLGCGFGWFCRFAAGQGAASVLGVDVSRNMLDRARGETVTDIVRYERADLEDYAPPAAAFDLVHSSLVFHYLAGLDGLLARVASALAPGGRLVCSVEHPLLTAHTPPGWIVDGAGREVWPVTGYLDEGPRVSDWLAPGVVKRHRTVEGYVGAVLRAGLRLTDLVEWAPSPEQIAARPEWARERERPFFLLLAAERPQAAQKTLG